MQYECNDEGKSALRHTTRREREMRVGLECHHTHPYHAWHSRRSAAPAAVRDATHRGYMADQSDSIVKSPFKDSIANPISGMKTTGLSACLSPLPSA